MNSNQHSFQQIMTIINWARSEILHSTEIALMNDPKMFSKIRGRILDVFGMGWGVEKKIREIFGPNWPRIGKAGNCSEIFGREDDPMSG